MSISSGALTPRRSPRRAAMGSWLMLAWVLATPATLAQAPLTFVNDQTSVRGISFRFVEDRPFEDTELMQQIALTEPGFFDRLKRLLPFVSPRPHRFDPITLQRDVVRLRNYLQRNGFLHPEIDYTASQLDTADNDIHVIFSIDAGPPLIIQDVGFFAPSGDYLYSAFDGALREEWIAFRDETTFRVGERYTEFARLRIQDEVLTWLKNRGFAFARIEAATDINPAQNTVDIAFAVDPGPVAYISEIVVEGNESVGADVVRRELPFKVGDRFELEELAEGQREVFSLNLFRLALVQVPEQPRDSTVTILVRVREAEPRFVTAQTGYARDIGVNAEAQWTHRNFLGAARTLTVQQLATTGLLASAPPAADGAPRIFRTAVTLRQPYLFVTDLSASVTPFLQFERDPLLRETPGFLGLNRRQFGVQSLLIYELSTFRAISLQHSFSRELSRTEAVADTVTTRDIFNKSVFTLNGTLGSVDDFLKPRRGFLVRPLLETAGSFIASELDYHKAALELVGYLPVRPRVTLAGRVYAGCLLPRGGSRDQADPVVENRFDPIRFYAGGGNDVRGYAPQALGPVLATADSVRVVEGELTVFGAELEPVGGLTKVAGNVEARLPFPGLGSSWQTAAFVDFGQVYPGDGFTHVGAERHPLRFGVGGGLRYETVFGYIRLDVGYKVNPAPSDVLSAEEYYLHQVEGVPLDELNPSFVDRIRLHLSIGQAF